MTSSFLPMDIEAEEGRRRIAYPDPLSGGKPYTIGVGHAGPEVTLGLRWSDAQINFALASDIARCERLIDAQYPWWRGLSDIRQDVLVQMVFQMGIGGLENFPHALAAIKAQQWQNAHDAMVDSNWARVQTPARANREAQQILTNVRAWAVATDALNTPTVTI